MKVHNMPCAVALTPRNYTEEELREITQWCDNTFGTKNWGIWHNAWDWACFKKEQDFIMFKLKWAK